MTKKGPVCTDGPRHQTAAGKVILKKKFMFSVHSMSSLSEFFGFGVFLEALKESAVLY